MIGIKDIYDIISNYNNYNGLTNYNNGYNIDDITNYMNIMIYFTVYLTFYLITNKKYWDIFTRIMSTINAIVCINAIYRVLTCETITIYSFLYHYGSNTLANGLTWFYIYLLVDGGFYLIYFIRNVNLSNFTTLAHHVVGGYGIYLIATERMGLGVGLYFAATEISTPLLNLSWYLYTNKIENKFSNMIFTLFYIVFVLTRVITIPFLCYYLYVNHISIQQLNWLHYIMLYGGSSCLVGLNIVWTIMLSKKLC